MSINARCQVTSNTTYLSYNDSTLCWDGIIIRVYYPSANPGEIQQTFSKNPPSINDYIIDEAGKVWKITNIDTTWTKTSSYHFRISIQVQNRQQIEDVEPECGITNYGAITSLVNGVLSPITDTTMVKASVLNSALSFNLTNSSSLPQDYIALKCSTTGTKWKLYLIDKHLVTEDIS